MRAIGAAVVALVLDPCPPEGFYRREYHRLRVGRFRVVYVVDDDLITLERVPGWMTWRDLGSAYAVFQHLPLSPCIHDFECLIFFRAASASTPIPVS